MRHSARMLAAVLLAAICVNGWVAAADADLQEILARMKALEDKNRELEAKLHHATVVAEKRHGADAVVDQALAVSDAKLNSVITAPDPHCRPLKIGGYLDFSYQYNLINPDNRNNNLRVFDRDTNGFNLHLAEINFERLPAEAGQAGFRVDLTHGTDTDIFAPIDNSGQGPDRLFDLQQAYISYIAPIGNGITLDAGKFVTWSGFEVIEASDNLNSSRSLLFGLAIPFTHTGIRATYPVFKDKWTVGLGLVNGWDNIQDQNDSKTAIFLSNWTPTKWFNWVVTGTVGNEIATSETALFANSINPVGGGFDADDPTAPGFGAAQTGKLFDPGDTGVRFLLDTSLIFTPWEKWTFALNADWATEESGNTNGQWYGVAGYVKYQFHKDWYIANRTEYFNDEDGLRTGRNQALWETTITVDWQLSEPLHVRFEYRHDDSNVDSFSGKRGVSDTFDPTVNKTPFEDDSQDTLMMQWLYKF